MKTACVEVKVNGTWHGTSVACAEQAIEFVELFLLMGFEAKASMQPEVVHPQEDATFEKVIRDLFSGEHPF